MIQQSSRIPNKNKSQLLKNYLLGTYYIVSKNRHGVSPHEGSNTYISSTHTYQIITNCGKPERKVYVIEELTSIRDQGLVWEFINVFPYLDEYEEMVKREKKASAESL